MFSDNSLLQYKLSLVKRAWEKYPDSKQTPTKLPIDSALFVLISTETSIIGIIRFDSNNRFL